MNAQQSTAPAAPQGELVWMHALGQAVCAEGRPALKREATFGQLLDPVTRDLHQRLTDRGPLEERPAWLQETARVADAEARRAADRVVAAVAADLPSILRAQLAVYLAGAPASIRQVLRRPADPTGTRVPVDLPLEQPEDLLPYLPPRAALYQPGDRADGLGEWRLAELLGLSASCEVWKGRPLRDGGKTVVLKFCTEPLGRDGRLYSEAGRLVELLQEDPQLGVIALQDIYLDRMPAGVRCELVEGGGLAGLIQKWARSGGPPQVEQAARLLLGLAQIVAGMHRLDKGVVHGDLKPAHLLLQQPVPGGPLVLRVADYGLGRVLGGLARQRERQGAPSGLSRLLAHRGAHTPLYTSPQLRYGGEPALADDVYAVGVIGYQMLCADVTIPVGPDWRERLGRLNVPLPLILLLRACLVEQADRRITSDGLADELTELLAPRVVATVGAEPPAAGPGEGQARKVHEALERVQRLQQRARQLESAHDVAGALRILEAIPARMRDNELYSSLCQRNADVAVPSS